MYGGIGAAVIALIILLIVLSSKGKNPEPPKPVPPVEYPRIFNPYVIYESTPMYQTYSMKTYLLSYNETLASVGNFSLPFFNGNYSDSPILRQAEVRAAVVNNYDTMRLEILDS